MKFHFLVPMNSWSWSHTLQGSSSQRDRCLTLYVQWELYLQYLLNLFLNNNYARSALFKIFFFFIERSICSYIMALSYTSTWTIHVFKSAMFEIMCLHRHHSFYCKLSMIPLRETIALDIYILLLFTWNTAFLNLFTIFAPIPKRFVILTPIWAGCCWIKWA